MNNFWIGAGAVLGSGIITAIGYIYYKVRILEAALLKSQEEVKDAKIVSSAHALSDAERDELSRDALERYSKD